MSAGTVGVFCACSECGDVLCLQNVCFVLAECGNILCLQ